MKTPRLALAGLALFTVAGIALTGCAAKSASTTPSASPSPSPIAPKEALRASIKQLDTTSSAVAVDASTGPIRITMDPASKSLYLTATLTENDSTVKMDILMVDKDVWVKFDYGQQANALLGVQPTKWMPVDVATLKKLDMPVTGQMSDALDLAGLFDGLVDVTRVDGQHLTGTIDLTKVTRYNKPEAQILTKAGEKAKSVPFTASLDDKGRLTNLKLDGQGIDAALSVEFSVSGYGSTQAPAKPGPADVIDMPSQLKEALNS